MSRLLVVLLTCLTSIAMADALRLVTLSDPEGDDVGNGSLVYPKGTELRQGDLDLRSLDISRDEKGFWFVATFNNLIREKWWVPDDSRDASSQRGKRTLPFDFNLDIYIDTDRKAGSGHMFTLPGRKVRIDPRYAWERVVILSPQPKTSRAQLLETLKKKFPDRPQGEAEASIDETMFFASKRRIGGKSISFFVPREFIGASDGTDWAVTAFVTAASPAMEDDNLGVMQPGKEPSPSTLGYTTANAPAPVIDVLLPTAEQQFKLLSSGEPLTGLSWGASSVEKFEIEGGVQSFKSRLKALKELLDQRLIDETDYKAQRERILHEL
jgi:carbohydrate-binding DOMON domain-containing protein